MKNKEKKKGCNHAIASHEGHGLEYIRTTKWIVGATKDSLNDNCCGGVVLFNYCPFCGVEVRDLSEAILK